MLWFSSMYVQPLNKERQRQGEMKVWIKVVSGLIVPGAILLLLLLLSIFLFLRCRRRRKLSSTSISSTTTITPFTEEEARYREDSFQSALAKLHLSYKSRSSKPSRRFNHHHHQQRNQHQQQQQTQPQQRPPFHWDDHPLLVKEAAEYGWSRFAFTSRIPAPRSTTPLLGLCAACDAGGPGKEREIDWELPVGSSEFMQTVRINPGGSKRNGSSTPLTPDASSACSVRMSLPLPGPRVGGSSFPQEAYFEITILYVQIQKHRTPRASRRGLVDDSESDRAKLIREQSMGAQSDSAAHSPVQDSKLSNGEESKITSSNYPVISLGLTTEDIPSSRWWMPGTYSGSIGFNSNGSVSLDGMKLVMEREKASWAGVNKVVGCGFNPSKRKVFLTVDGELVHVVHCKSEVYKSPLYPVVAAARMDVMVLVNLGQRAFAYAPANARRAPNPCFARSPSDGGGFGERRELFSMGRPESEFFDIIRWSGGGGKKSNSGSCIDGSVGGEDVESELFEIALHC